MKPTAAFTVGLWTGALVVVVAGAVRFWCGAPPAESAPNLAAELERQQAEVRRLDQDNARLTAEVQRLRQTLAESRARAAAPTRPAARPRVEAAATAPGEATQWIEAAVANGDLDALPRLEAAALDNDPRALRALALLSSGDGAATLLRVWGSGRLTAPNLIQATRWLGATVEINPRAAEWVQALTAGERVEARIVTAAAEGLADAKLATTLTGKVDYLARMRLLDSLLPAVADAALLDQLGKSRESLLGQWAAAGGASAEPGAAP